MEINGRATRRICAQSMLGRWIVISVASDTTVEGLRESRLKYDLGKIDRIASR